MPVQPPKPPLPPPAGSVPQKAPRPEPQYVYVNGVSMDASLTEIHWNWLLHGQPSPVTFLMTFECAKELMFHLQKLIVDFEAVLGAKIMTVSEMSDLTKKFHAKQIQERQLAASVAEANRPKLPDFVENGVQYFGEVYWDCPKCRISTRYEKVPKSMPVRVVCSNCQHAVNHEFGEMAKGGTITPIADLLPKTESPPVNPEALPSSSVS